MVEKQWDPLELIAAGMIIKSVRGKGEYVDDYIKQLREQSEGSSPLKIKNSNLADIIDEALRREVDCELERIQQEENWRDHFPKG